MSTVQVFVYNLKYVKYGKLPTVACKNAFNFYATCELLTHPAHHVCFQLTFRLFVRRSRGSNLLINRLLSRHM